MEDQKVINEIKIVFSKGEHNNTWNIFYENLVEHKGAGVSDEDAEKLLNAFKKL